MSKQIIIKKVYWSSRKTFSLKIDENGALIIRAPKGSTINDIAQIINRKIRWIEKAQKSVQEFREHIKPKNYVDGEAFFYLGAKVTLRFVETDRVYADGNYLFAPSVGKESAQREIQQWYLNEARKIFSHIVADFAKKMNVAYSIIRVKNSRTRWGSCGKNGSINLNWRLVMTPPEVIEYIIIHELAHIVHRNHSKHFYNFVRRFCPNYKAMEQWLRTNSHIMKMFR